MLFPHLRPQPLVSVSPSEGHYREIYRDGRVMDTSFIGKILNGLIPYYPKTRVDICSLLSESSQQEFAASADACGPLETFSTSESLRTGLSRWIIREPKESKLTMLKDAGHAASILEKELDLQADIRNLVQNESAGFRLCRIAFVEMMVATNR